MAATADARQFAWAWEWKQPRPPRGSTRRRYSRDPTWTRRRRRNTSTKGLPSAPCGGVAGRNVMTYCVETFYYPFDVRSCTVGKLYKNWRRTITSSRPSRRALWAVGLHTVRMGEARRRETTTRTACAPPRCILFSGREYAEAGTGSGGKAALSARSDRGIHMHRMWRQRSTATNNASATRIGDGRCARFRCPHPITN